MRLGIAARPNPCIGRKTMLTPILATVDETTDAALRIQSFMAAKQMQGLASNESDSESGRTRKPMRTTEHTQTPHEPPSHAGPIARPRNRCSQTAIKNRLGTVGVGKAEDVPGVASRRMCSMDTAGMPRPKHA